MKITNVFVDNIKLYKRFFFEIQRNRSEWNDFKAKHSFTDGIHINRKITEWITQPHSYEQNTKLSLFKGTNKKKVQYMKITKNKEDGLKHFKDMLKLTNLLSKIKRTII